MLVLGGPFLDDAGGLAILRADAAAAARMAAADPGVTSGLLTVTVRPWLAAMGTVAPLEPRHGGGRSFEVVAVVGAPPEKVWASWTEPSGLQSFFAEKARVEAVPGGPYEILFDLSAPVGSQGAEGCRVVDVDPGRAITFTWNAPPTMPAVRPAHTLVTVLLEPAAEGATRVRLQHRNFGEGPAWDEAYAYFQRAWPRVLEQLRRVHEGG
jgi:uncharacterized protein YndB with AHSA1/START domain